MPSCQQPDAAFRGSMVYWYNSTSFRDDLAWAAAWMYKATGDTDYLGDAYGFWDTHKMLEGDYDIRYLVQPLCPLCGLVSARPSPHGLDLLGLGLQ